MRTSAFTTPTAVSSAAQAVVQSGTTLQIFNVGSTGLAADPVSTHPNLARPTGFNAIVARFANGDILHYRDAGGFGGEFRIQNFIAGTVSGSVFTPQTGDLNHVYVTGDAFLAAVNVDLGQRWGYADTTYPGPGSGKRRLLVPQEGDRTGYSPLARITAGGLVNLPLDGVPRVLARANKLFSYDVSLGFANRTFPRAGYVLIPARLTVDEIDVAPSTDPGQFAGTTRCVVSKASTTYYGLIRASQAGALFIPLSSYYSYRIGITSSDYGSGVYVAWGYPDWTDANDGYQGVPQYNVEAVLGDVAILQSPSYIKSASISSGQTIVERQLVTVQIAGVPSIGAVLAYSPAFGTPFSDRGEVQISFDAGQTFRTAGLYYKGQFDAQPQQGAPDMNAFKGSTPLFIV